MLDIDGFQVFHTRFKQGNLLKNSIGEELFLDVIQTRLQIIVLNLE